MILFALIVKHTTFQENFSATVGDIVSDAFLKSKLKDLITEINEYFDFKKLFYLR